MQLLLSSGCVQEYITVVNVQNSSFAFYLTVKTKKLLNLGI
jgi:hypothetical protein